MLSVSNPANGTMIKQLVPDTPESLAGKIAICHKMQKVWQDTPLEERKAKIITFNQLLQDNREDFAKTTSLETGRPMKQVAGEIQATAARIQYFLDHVDEVMASRDVFKDSSVEEIVTMEPLGVIANISAWNYPYFVGSNVFIPALLTGNSVLYKASEFASLTGQKIFEIMIQAGVPEGAFTLVLGDGNVGAQILQLPIQGVFFTGSYATGLKINQAVAPQLLKVGMELGGKDPCFVTEDVDVEAVAAAVADGAFYNCGQSCCSVERIYVHQDIYDSFLESFTQAVAAMKVGDPLEESTYLGPMTRHQQRQVLMDQIEDAIKKGATLHLGGNPIEGSGNYFEPTILTEVNHSMVLMKEESFGPIIGIQKVANDQEAVTLMNDTDYGLTAAVYCRDRQRSRSIMYHLDAGTVYNNCCDRVSPYSPWSGRKHSGIGSTLGTLGISTFLRPKAWHLK